MFVLLCPTVSYSVTAIAVLYYQKNYLALDFCDVRSANLHTHIYTNTERYNEPTEPIDTVNILPLAGFEPTSMTSPPSRTSTLLTIPKKGCSGSADIDDD